MTRNTCPRVRATFWRVLWRAGIMHASTTAIALAERCFNTDTDLIRGISSIAVAAPKLCFVTGESKEVGNAFRGKRNPD
jgi:2-ketocyclohexanecarboxyl-CoA hydrolase